MLVSMKTMKLLSFMLALLFLAGCATTFRPWLLSEIHAGMNKAQVVKTLGEPDYVETQDGSELLHYTYREDYTPSPMDYDFDRQRNNFVSQSQKVAHGLKEYHYVVVLADGKVINYKELTN